MKSLALRTWHICLTVIITIFIAGCYRPTSPRRTSKKEKREYLKQLWRRKPQKSIKHMTLEEAVAAAIFYEETGSQDLLIATYNQIMSKTDNPDVVAHYGIKLADLYFGDGNFAEAKKQYKRIITLYPGYQDIERARFREVMTHFWSAPQTSRDQSATIATIKLGKLYLKDYPQGAGAEQVHGMIAASYRKLLESEQLIIDFYLNKYNYTHAEEPLRAAEQRLTYVKETLLPQMQLFVPEATALTEQLELPEQLLTSEATPAEREAAAALIAQKTDRIRAFFTDTTPVKIAPKDMRDRF